MGTDLTTTCDMPTPENSVELRGDCPKETIDVLDAISAARRLTRTQLVNEILRDWAQARLHEMNLLQRVTRSNPAPAEPLPRGVDRIRNGGGS